MTETLPPFSTRQVAGLLGISPKTVAAHCKRGLYGRKAHGRGPGPHGRWEIPRQELATMMNDPSLLTVEVPPDPKPGLKPGQRRKARKLGMYGQAVPRFRAAEGAPEGEPSVPVQTEGEARVSPEEPPCDALDDEGPATGMRCPGCDAPLEVVRSHGKLACRVCGVDLEVTVPAKKQTVFRALRPLAPREGTDGS